MRPPPPSSALQLPILNLPSLGQLDHAAIFTWRNSAHQVLLYSRSPHLRQVDHATTTVSTFRGVLHSLENFNTKLPAAPRNCFSTLSSYPQKLREREKKQCSHLPCQHTLSHPHNTSALPTSIRPLRTNPSAPLSVYLTSCCAEKKGERRRWSSTISPAVFLSRPSPHACTYLHVCVPMVPCLFDMVTSRCQLDLHILPIIY
jgi:hypothetical protein